MQYFSPKRLFSPVGFCRIGNVVFRLLLIFIAFLKYERNTSVAGGTFARNH